MKYGSLLGVLGVPLDGAFPTAARLGFDGVELDWFQRSDAAPGGPLAPESRAAIRAAAAAAGTAIPSVAAHFLNASGIASPAAAERAEGLEAVREGIALCRDLGAGILLVPFFGPAEIDGEPGVSRLIESLQTLAPEAAAAGVRLGIESALRGDAVARIIDAVSSPAVGAYWDMANGMALGFDPLQEIEWLGRRILQVHAKEFTGPAPAARKPGQYPGLNQKPFGQGDVPVRAVLAALRRQGYDGWIVLETGAFGNPETAARDALRFLQESAPAP